MDSNTLNAKAVLAKISAGTNIALYPEAKIPRLNACMVFTDCAYLTSMRTWSTVLAI